MDSLVSGSLGTLDWLHLQMPETVFKSAKASACAIKNPVRDLVAFWCLPARQEPDKWVRQPPLTNPESGLHMFSELQPSQLQTDWLTPREIFLSQIKFHSRDKVSHFASRIVSRTQGVVGGVRGCRGSRARQPYSHDRKQAALGMTL